MGRKKGSELTKKHKKNIAKAHKGKKLSKEHKRKLSEAKLGKKRKLFSEEHKLNISKGKMYTVMSEETKAKMSDIHKRRILVDTEHYLMLVDCAAYHNQILSECLSNLLELAFEKLTHHEGGRF